MYQQIINSPILQVVGIVVILVYFHLAGIIDGILWSQRGADATKKNEHIWLVASRVCLGVIAAIPLHLLLTLACFFLFPLVHNGSYYQTRKQISAGKTYPDGWRSEPSSSSIADINFSYKTRLVLGAVGILGIFAITIFIL